MGWRRGEIAGYRAKILAVANDILIILESQPLSMYVQSVEIAR